VLVINNACNLRCRYCFGEYHSRSGNQDYSTAELKHLIDELHAQGTVYMIVHGGETLLRPDIGEIVSYIKQKGIYINLITNGFLLEKKIDEVKAVDGLCISLDGREENNDLVRGAGSFKAALNAIDLIKRMKIPLRVQATLTKYTRHDIGYLCDLAREKQFHLEFSLLFHSTPGMQDLILGDQDTRDVLREIIDYKKRGYPIFTSLRALNLALAWPYPYEKVYLTDADNPPGFHPGKCYFSRHLVTIDADGRMFPCFSLNNTFDALNVKSAGVSSAFEQCSAGKECRFCSSLSHIDWNIMLSLSPGFLMEQVKLHLRELFGRY